MEIPYRTDVITPAGWDMPVIVREVKAAVMIEFQEARDDADETDRRKEWRAVTDCATFLDGTPLTIEWIEQIPARYYKGLTEIFRKSVELGGLPLKVEGEEEPKN